MNPISTVMVVYAGNEPPIITLPSVQVHILPESDLIPSALEDAVRRYPQDRQGWIRQQVIKFLAAANCNTEATLICDSDTFLCENQVWLNRLGIQQLQISHEYSEVYEQHYLEFFGEKPNQSKRISFVTHHQLMQKNIIHEMFGEDMSRLINWVDLGNAAEVSPVSEYHTYGRYISSRHTDRYRFSRWNNLFIDATHEDVTKILNNHSSDYSSISAHRY
jgi:hypothetical protein